SRDVQGAWCQSGRVKSQPDKGHPWQHHRPERTPDRAGRTSARSAPPPGDGPLEVSMRALVLSCAAAVLISPGAASAQDACGKVATLAKSLKATTIVSSRPIPANAQEKLPAF